MTSTLVAEQLPRLAGTSAALVPAQGYELTRTGIRFLRTLSEPEYDSLVRRVAVVSNATPWQLGDWLVAGTGRYDEAGVTYQRVHQLTGRNLDTIRMYLRVALSYSHDERDLMPWTFYREALRLPAVERISVLRVAQQNRWTFAEFLAFLSRRLGLAAATDPSEIDVHLSTARPHRNRTRNHLVTCPQCQHTFDARGRLSTNRNGVADGTRNAAGK